MACSASSAAVPDEEAALAEAVRAAVARGDALSDRLNAWLTQPFRCAEDYNGRPGVVVPRARALADAAALLAGEADDVAPASLRYLGTLDGTRWPTVEGGLI